MPADVTRRFPSSVKLTFPARLPLSSAADAISSSPRLLISKRAKVCEREKYVRGYQMNERRQTCASEIGLVETKLSLSLSLSLSFSLRLFRTISFRYESTLSAMKKCY